MATLTDNEILEMFADLLIERTPSGDIFDLMEQVSKMENGAYMHIATTTSVENAEHYSEKSPRELMIGAYNLGFRG